MGRDFGTVSNNPALTGERRFAMSVSRERTVSLWMETEVADALKPWLGKLAKGSGLNV